VAQSVLKGLSRYNLEPTFRFLQGQGQGQGLREFELPAPSDVIKLTTIVVDRLGANENPEMGFVVLIGLLGWW
jgi:hypothetical protein